MAVFSAQPVIEIAPEFAAERALKVAPATLLYLIVARVRMALQSRAGPARGALEARLAGPRGGGAAGRSPRTATPPRGSRRPRRGAGGAPFSPPLSPPLSTAEPSPSIRRASRMSPIC